MKPVQDFHKQSLGEGPAKLIFLKVFFCSFSAYQAMRFLVRVMRSELCGSLILGLEGGGSHPDNLQTLFYTAPVEQDHDLVLLGTLVQH